MSLRTFSYGGGTQSTAALVLAGRGDLDYRTFLFANVGEDSERPATLVYVHEVAMPYAEARGIELVELRKTLRDGSTQTLMEKIHSSERSIPIPVRMSPDAAPGNRTCTAEFKIRVIEKELRRRGATKHDKATVGIGISLDEWHRAKSAEDPRSPVQLRDYPLLDRRITRADCMQIIRSEGLPQPPRSACFFCPFHTREEWRRLARQEPELFAKACDLEDELYARG
ncbi:MAG: phosphoadenosine phosphosulfate reductase, partial [Pseudonocardiaceae bacterium]|nr:phosphoadenosine phosphosulfate reductase [Pseudonocardiaceae bacterium]